MKPSKDETVVAHNGKLLGLEAPWRVHAAQLDLLRGRVELEVAWDEGAAVVCPECRKECARHDHAPEREWRHLNVMQFLTVIRARVPRCRCPEHGVKTMRTPWSEPGSHFTLHFEATRKSRPALRSCWRSTCKPPRLGAIKSSSSNSGRSPTPHTAPNSSRTGIAASCALASPESKRWPRPSKNI